MIEISTESCSYNLPQYTRPETDLYVYLESFWFKYVYKCINFIKTKIVTIRKTNFLFFRHLAFVYYTLVFSIPFFFTEIDWISTKNKNKQFLFSNEIRFYTHTVISFRIQQILGSVDKNCIFSCNVHWS